MISNKFREEKSYVICGRFFTGRGMYWRSTIAGLAGLDAASHPPAGAMGGRPSLPGARTRSRATSRSW